MLQMIEKFGTKVKTLRDKHLDREFQRFHFNSRRKRMSTIIKNIGKSENGYDKRLHLKGAAEIVLSSCTHYLD